MALAVRNGKRFRESRAGNEIMEGIVQFDTSYPTGGEAMPAGHGWNNARVKRVTLDSDATHTYLYDKVADKVAAWTAGAEVANLTDLSAKNNVRFRLEVLK